VLTPGAEVVAKHPVYAGAWWGRVTAVDGEQVGVVFDLEKRHAPANRSAPTYWLPAAVVLARTLPLVYLGDDVGAHYWRAEQEVQAERRAFLNDPVNKGAAFRPHTYMD
jgi:hypothetical protein